MVRIDTSRSAPDVFRVFESHPGGIGIASLPRCFAATSPVVLHRQLSPLKLCPGGHLQLRTPRALRLAPSTTSSSFEFYFFLVPDAFSLMVQGRLDARFVRVRLG